MDTVREDELIGVAEDYCGVVIKAVLEAPNAAGECTPYTGPLPNKAQAQVLFRLCRYDNDAKMAEIWTQGQQRFGNECSPAELESIGKALDFQILIQVTAELLKIDPEATAQADRDKTLLQWTNDMLSWFKRFADALDGDKPGV